MASSVLVLLSLVTFQDTSERKIQTLIERLRADTIEERAEASEALRNLGPKALSALRAAEKGATGEVASRVRTLIRTIEFGKLLGPRLVAAFPGVDERLAVGRLHEWTNVFFEARAHRMRGGDGLLRKDLAALFPRALRGAQESEERQRLFEVAGDEGLRTLIPTLVSALKDPDGEIRAAAAGSLRKLDARESLRDLLPLLRDRSPRVREAAIQGVAALGGRKTAPELVALVDDTDSEVRAKAMSVLSTWSAEEALPAFLGRVPAPDEEEETEALHGALVVSRGKERTKVLDRFLSHPKVRIRRGAIHAVYALNLFELGPSIIPMLRDSDPDVRADAADALGSLSEPEAVPELLRLLKDPEERVQRDALYALVWIGSPEAVPRFRRMARDPDHPIARAALHGLMTLAGEEALPILGELLESPSDEKFWSAVEGFRNLESREGISKSLRKLGTRKFEDPASVSKITALGNGRGNEGKPIGRLLAPGDLPILEAYVKGGSETLRRAALGLLSDAPQVPAGPIATAFLKRSDLSPEARDLAIRVLALHDPPRALGEYRKARDELTQEDRRSIVNFIRRNRIRQGIPYVMECLEGKNALAEEDAIGREAAVIALGELKAVDAVPLLGGLAREGGVDPATAIHALGNIGTRDAVKELLPFLVGNSTDLRERALMNLDRGAGKDLIPRLRGFLNDSDSQMRLWAVQLLTSWSDREDIGSLERMVRDPDPHVRAQVMRALRILGGGAVPEDLEIYADDPDTQNAAETLLWVLRSGKAECAGRLVGGGWWKELALNALREPEAFARLDRMVPRGWAAKGPRTGIARRLASDAGFELEVAGSMSRMWRREIEEETEYVNTWWYETWFEAIENILMHRGATVTPGVTLIVEKDRVRVVPLRDASSFWRCWWSDRQKKGR